MLWMASIQGLYVITIRSLVHITAHSTCGPGKPRKPEYTIYQLYIICKTKHDNGINNNTQTVNEDGTYE